MINALLAGDANFKFVVCTFAPYTGSKTYTYKTMQDFAPGDYAVVETPSNGFQVVQVREVVEPSEVDLNAPYSYKWVVSKVDFEAYETQLELENKLRTLVNKSRNRQALREAKEALLQEIDVQTATEISKLVRL